MLSIMNFRGLTWNLNGTRKFLANVAVLAFLATFGVIFLQETFEVAGGASRFDLVLPGFVPRERRASRGPRGRASGGLKTFLNGRLFGHGLITEVPSSFDEVLITRWAEGNRPGILFVNVYVPRHSEEGTEHSWMMDVVCFPQVFSHSNFLFLFFVVCLLSPFSYLKFLFFFVPLAIRLQLHVL